MSDKARARLLQLQNQLLQEDKKESETRTRSNRKGSTKASSSVKRSLSSSNITSVGSLKRRDSQDVSVSTQGSNTSIITSGTRKKNVFNGSKSVVSLLSSDDEESYTLAAGSKTGAVSSSVPAAFGGWRTAVYTCGSGSQGQLGRNQESVLDASLQRVTMPHSTDTNTSINDEPLMLCAAGHCTYCLTTTGKVYGWGLGGGLVPKPKKKGETGPGNQSCGITQLLIGIQVSKIACGPDHAAACTGKGELVTWGNNNDGKLGHGDIKSSHTPRRVEALRGLHVSDVSCGERHTACVAHANNGNIGGRIYTWGSGRAGQLGYGDTSDRLLPYEKPVHFFDLDRASSAENERPGTRIMHTVLSVACGMHHTLAIVRSWPQGAAVTSLYSFGWGEHGRLGLGLDEMAASPCLVQPELFEGSPIQACAGAQHSLVLTDRGIAYAFGSNEFGQLGSARPRDVLQSDVPRRVALPEGILAVHACAGSNHNAIISNTGVLLTWGFGQEGQLGQGEEADRYLPKAAPFGTQKPSGSTDGQLLERKNSRLGLGLALGLSVTTSSCSTEEQRAGLGSIVPRCVALGSAHTAVLVFNGSIKGLSEQLDLIESDLQEVDDTNGTNILQTSKLESQILRHIPAKSFTEETEEHLTSSSDEETDTRENEEQMIVAQNELIASMREEDAKRLRLKRQIESQPSIIPPAARSGILGEEETEVALDSISNHSVMQLRALINAVNIEDTEVTHDNDNGSTTNSIRGADEERSAEQEFSGGEFFEENSDDRGANVNQSVAAAAGPKVDIYYGGPGQDPDKSWVANSVKRAIQRKERELSRSRTSTPGGAGLGVDPLFDTTVGSGGTSGMFPSVTVTSSSGSKKVLRGPRVHVTAVRKLSAGDGRG